MLKQQQMFVTNHQASVKRKHASDDESCDDDDHLSVTAGQL